MDSISIPPVKIRLNVLYERIGFDCKDTSLFSASPYGGPIAIANYVSANVSYWEITVQTCAGVKLSSIKVEMRDVHAIYWTKCHRLIVLSKRGHVFIYTPLGKRVGAFNFGQESKIIQSRLFSSAVGNTGLAILTETNYIFLVNSVLDSVVWRLPQIEHAEMPAAWNVLSPTTFGQVTVISVVKNNFYLGIQGFPSQLLNVPWKLSAGDYLDACINWDSSMIAFTHTSFIIQIANSDFALLHTIRVPHELPTSSLSASSSSSRLFWCGSQAVAAKRSKISLEVYSTESHNYELIFDGDIRLDGEADGVKVFTRDELSFVSLLPEEVDAVLGVTSEQPGAILYDASEKLCKKGTGVYEYINMIGDSLEKAVQQCLIAAAHQFDCVLQQKLLKAANLGKSLASRHDASQFVDTCRVMRVLNCIRQPYIGIPMSFAQSTELKMIVLIDRLIDLGHWPLALDFCNYMKLEPKDGVHRVLANWALNKIEIAKKEKELGRNPNCALLSDLIVSKFSTFPDVSFADVAMKAVEAGLPDLAVLLLEKETHLDRRVQMLLSLDKIEMALKTATKSQQPDLLHLVLQHLRRTQRKDQVDRALSKYPQALSLYQDYLRETAPSHAMALYQQYDDFARQAVTRLEEAEAMPWNPFEMSQKIGSIVSAKECLTSLKETGTEQLLDEGTKLLELCEPLETKPGFASVDKTSLRSVYVWAAGQKEEDLAFLETLKKKFKLSDKLCCVWKIEGYAKYGKWHHLENLSRAKKLPVGYMPFVEACARYQNPQLGAQMIEKLAFPEEVVEGYLLVNAPKKAALYAVEKRLNDVVDMLRSKYRTNQVEGPEIMEILNAYRRTV